MSTDLARPSPLAGRASWLQTPRHDVAMALVWVPFAAAAHLAADDPASLRWLVSATLAFSFAHQPLTLWLVYGDTEQRRAHPGLFAWAPAVAVVVVGTGSAVRPDIVAVVGGIWNVGHTIRQRYGISRLYGRRCGIDCADDNRLLWSWLAMAVLVAVSGADLGASARGVGLGPRNTAAVDALTWVRDVTVVLLPAAAVAVVVLTARAVRDELRRGTHSPARLVYLGSTAALLAVLAVEPVVGFVAYVGAHAAEYLLVVRWRIGRAAQRSTAGDRVGALGRRLGSGGTMVLYGAAVVALIVAVRAGQGSHFVTTVVLTFSALHLLYDGFIWRAPPVPAGGGRQRRPNPKTLSIVGE